MRDYTQNRKRVLVTGIGAITPLGNTFAETWQNVLAGKSGIDHIKSFDPDEFNLKTKIGGEVKNFDAKEYIDIKRFKRTDRFSHFALVACQDAIKSARLNFCDHDSFVKSGYNAYDFGVVLGTGIGGFFTLDEQLQIFYNAGSHRVSPFSVPKLMSNAGASSISNYYGFKGASKTINTACAAGADSIGNALQLIRLGVCKVVIAGASEAVLTPFGIALFERMGALTKDFNDAPTKASRPFDTQRSGFVMSEGATVFVLEDAEFARARNALPIAELAGYGATCDAHDITAPDPSGEPASETMRMAIKDAGARITDVAHINAHGTSTELNDAMETRAIRLLFGTRTPQIKVSATKSMTGHLLGSGGALEAGFTAQSVLSKCIPPTINLDNVEHIKNANSQNEGCDMSVSEEYNLNHVRSRTAIYHKHLALSNSFGFGGHNAVLAFKRV